MILSASNMPFLESAQYAYAELANSSMAMLALHLTIL